MSSARIVVAAALLVFAACSGQSAKEEFIEQADRLCREADKRTREIEVPRTPRGLTQFVDRAQEITGDLLADLRALEVPEEGAETVERMFDSIEEAMSHLPAMAEAAEARDTLAMEQLARKLEAASSDANRLAREYGLKDCGRAKPSAVP